MPARGYFFKRAVSDAREPESVALPDGVAKECHPYNVAARLVIMQRVSYERYLTGFDAPHDLSTQLLFRVRRQDSASALAHLDQQKFLQQVLLTPAQSTLGPAHLYCLRFRIRRIIDRARMEA